jgi:transcriptional regulator with GAF, ATPase, and Fis domain
MQCTKCGSENPANKNFCGDCGAPLAGDCHTSKSGGMPAVSTTAGGFASDIAWLRRVYELGTAFVERLELDDLIPFVLARCREVLNAEGVAVLFIDEERNELYFPYVSEDDPEVAKRLTGLRFPAERGIAGAVLRSGRAEKVDDVGSDPRFFSGVDRKTGMATGSIIAAPLIAAPLITDEGSLGVLEAVNRRGGGPFSESDLALFEALAASVAVAIRNARRFGQMKESEQRLRVQVGSLRRELASHDRFGELIATSHAMADVLRLMESAAASSIAVLIEGETGTGKELVAHAIHRASDRADGPFVAVNCAALPEALLESELFGHRRGAFTGATADHPGFFKAAAGGVIFLDEIGELPFAMQAKLLRVLQDGEVTAVGDTRPQKVDVRVIAATNRDLRAAVAAKAFREDLYYRLAAFPIHLPPLRERREDIPLLAASFLEAACQRHHKPLGGFDPATIELLGRAVWPGNVRELQNEIERAVAIAHTGETITPTHLSPNLRSAELASQLSVKAPGLESILQDREPGRKGQSVARPLREARADFEARYIAKVLAENDGSISRAALALGISRVALHQKIKDYGLR